jgi:hypothetical protein
VAQHVRGYFLSLQRWALAFGGSLVASYQSLDGIPTQRPPTTAGEDWRCWLGRTLAEPLGQHGNRFLTQWGTSLFSPFSFAAEMRPAAQNHIVALQANQFGHPQSCLYRYQQQGVVPTPSPGCLVRGRYQRVDLFLAEVFDQSPSIALAGDGQYATTLLGVGWLLEGDVMKEGMDCRQPGVPTPGAIPAFLLEVIEEVADKGRVQIFER